MAQAKKPPEEISTTIPVLWDRVDPILPKPANLFVVLARPDEVVLTFGFLAPIVAGTPQQEREQTQKLAAEGMAPELVARVVLNVSNAQALHRVLGQQLGHLSNQSDTPS